MNHQKLSTTNFKETIRTLKFIHCYSTDNFSLDQI